MESLGGSIAAATLIVWIAVAVVCVVIVSVMWVRRYRRRKFLEDALRFKQTNP